MRRLNTKFDTNGSRAIIVRTMFAADIAGKYGPNRRRAQGGRSFLVYRSSMAGKKKPLSVKPATIVRVQVVMPQPAQIVKLQETRVLRERVVVKDGIVTKPTVHREREREKPIVRERIVEREKPIVRERIVEREKPIVRERIVEREKPVVRERIAERQKPIVRELIVEREKPASDSALKGAHQRNKIAESEQTKAPALRDSMSSAMPAFGRTFAKRGVRNEAVKSMFKRQSRAREFAFRMLEDEAGRSSESPNTDAIAKAAASMEKSEFASYADSIDSRSDRNMNMANRGSLEPILIKKQRSSPGVRQVVPISSRDDASRQWNAVVLINRRTMDRMKSVSARMAAPNPSKQTTAEGNKLADRVQESLKVQRFGQEAQSKPEEARDAQSLHREPASGQDAHRQSESKSGTAEQPVTGAAEPARPVDSGLARKNETARGSEPTDKLAVDKRLLGVDSSIDRISVTMSEALPAETAFPIALRTIDHLGLTVRLMSARAERLGSAFVLRNRAEPGTAETGISSPSKLILRRSAANPNTFITAKRIANGTTGINAGNDANKDTERSVRELAQAMTAPASVYPSTVNREPAHGQSADSMSNNGPRGNPVSSSDSSANKPVGPERAASASLVNLRLAKGSFGSKGLSYKPKPTAGQSEKRAVPWTSPGQGMLRLSANVKARLGAPGGFAASAKRAMPTGMIVHASRRGLSVLGRIANRTDVDPVGTATRQTKGAQPNVAQSLAAQQNTVQPNAAQSHTARQNATQPHATQPNAARPNTGGSNPASNVSATNVSAISPTISANEASSSVLHPVTDPAIMHPLEHAKREFENDAQRSSDRSSELTRLSRAEPALSDSSGQIPRVRFTFRNRLIGSFAPNNPEQGDRAGGDIQRRPTAAIRVSSAVTPLASRFASATNHRGSAPTIGNGDARQVNLQWTARTLRSMTAARTQSSASNRTGTPANGTAADGVQTAQWTQTAQLTQMAHPMHPMTRQLLSSSESLPSAAPSQPEEHPLVMIPSLVPAALRRTRPSDVRLTSAKPNLASVPAAMELRRNAAQPVNAPAEPATAAVTVEAPPHIDAKQLQKAIEAMPQLNPDQLADRVYAALMKKMKFERRLRGY